MPNFPSLVWSLTFEVAPAQRWQSLVRPHVACFPSPHTNTLIAARLKIQISFIPPCVSVLFLFPRASCGRERLDVGWLFVWDSHQLPAGILGWQSPTRPFPRVSTGYSGSARARQTRQSLLGHRLQTDPGDKFPGHRVPGICPGVRVWGFIPPEETHSSVANATVMTMSAGAIWNWEMLSSRGFLSCFGTAFVVTDLKTCIACLLKYEQAAGSGKNLSEKKKKSKELL